MSMSCGTNPALSTSALKNIHTIKINSVTEMTLKSLSSKRIKWDFYGLTTWRHLICFKDVCFQIITSTHCVLCIGECKENVRQEKCHMVQNNNSLIEKWILQNQYSIKTKQTRLWTPSMICLWGNAFCLVKFQKRVFQYFLS